jgi:hypothetical protein
MINEFRGLPAIPKVSNLQDSQIIRKLIHGGDGAFAVPSFRADLCAAFPDPRQGRGGNIATADFGASAFAMFFMQLHPRHARRGRSRAVAALFAALDGRPRPGREPTITLEAKAWLVSLACRKAKDLGYPHELWTTRLLARHAREHGPAQGHACLANLAQGTVCKILHQEEVKPHKVRYYLELRDPAFAEKMAEVLCVYRQVKILKKAA